MAMALYSRDYWRNPALVILAVATLFGLFGIYVASLAVLFALDDLEKGERFGSSLVFAFFYVLLLVCPLAGWVTFIFRRYRVAIMIASPPLLLVIISGLVSILN
ncbi:MULTISPECIES: hypothetical protein [unclassified Brevundimonas]|uniref:hypothetical protein n=1 Tax=unclassified Brevundimonas TaxID=2622653 RepID=UPI0025C3782D|nr:MULTISPECIES: hypothetical protein [unclassified Brevundimonas]